MIPPPYAELHCHSAYSFLDGASLPEELAVAALELGHTSLALTDHDGVYGSMEFAHAARAIGLRPIHGAELSLRGGRHLTLLVADERGWRNLCRLLTLAHAGTRERPRDPIPPAVSVEEVCAHAEGLHCMTGCAQHGVHDEDGVRVLRDAFGTEHLRESWLVEDRWWTDRPLRRRYWEIVTGSGRVLVVFHDLTGSGWFRQ